MNTKVFLSGYTFQMFYCHEKGGSFTFNCFVTEVLYVKQVND